MGTEGRVVVGGLLWLNGNCWKCLCGNQLEIDGMGKRSQGCG